MTRAKVEIGMRYVAALTAKVAKPSANVDHTPKRTRTKMRAEETAYAVPTIELEKFIVSMEAAVVPGRAMTRCAAQDASLGGPLQLNAY